jgi:hypothetical protein
MYGESQFVIDSTYYINKRILFPRNNDACHINEDEQVKYTKV